MNFEPLTANEESFLRAFLADSKARWISGDLVRQFFGKAMATIEFLRQTEEQVGKIAVYYAAENEKKQSFIYGLAERVYAQSELLSRKAEKK